MILFLLSWHIGCFNKSAFHLIVEKRSDTKVYTTNGKKKMVNEKIEKGENKKDFIRKFYIFRYRFWNLMSERFLEDLSCFFSQGNQFVIVWKTLETHKF